MIVEYIGIPGCGKTFRANLYKNELKRQGISFIDLSRWKGAPLWLKLFYKVTDRTFVILPKYRIMRNRLRILCKDIYGRSPKYLPFSVDYCIDRIISSIFLEDVFGNLTKIAINDEGLMQWVVFLNLQYGVDLNNILLQIHPLNKNVKTNFIDTDVKTAFGNIKKRDRHICSMDEMEDFALKKYLEEFHLVCIHVMSLVNVCDEEK